MAFVYILYSKVLDRYYIGSCLDLNQRLEEHLERKYSDAFSTRASDWEIFFSLSTLEYEQARKIENHIKRMKSRVYLENLKKYPELVEKLVLKYKS